MKNFLQVLCPTSLLLLLAGMALMSPPANADTPGEGLTRPLVGKKLIQIGQDAPDTGYIRQNIREMEKTHFDGIAIVPTVKVGDKKGSMMWGGWFSPHRKWEYANFQHVVDDMRAAAPQRFKDNFMFITRHVISLKYDDGTTEPIRQPDWFADDFQTTIDNLALAARVSKDAGFKGIAFDFEQYGGGAYGTWRFPFNYGRTAASFPTAMPHSFDECRQQVRLRARQIMQAITREYPGIVIMLLPSAYDVTERTLGLAKITSPQLEGLATSDYSLYPSFLDGLREGAGPEVRLLEGNEYSYGYTIDQQFKDGRKKIDANAERFSSVSPSQAQKIGVSFGLWLDHRGWNLQAPFYANHFTPGEFQHALHSAMNNSDGYAWVWCEKAVFWPDSGLRKGPVTVPQEYKDAIASSKQPQPIGFRRDNRGAEAEPLPPSATLHPDYSDAKTFGPLSNEYEYVADLPKQWQFLADELDMGIGQYARLDWDTSAWPLIEIGDYYENRGYQFNGMAWYRCQLEIPQSLEGKPVYLHFGGIAGAPHVYVNGTWLPPSKTLPNGVLAWDITSKALYGKNNVVLVQIHNPAGPGGIYKSVKLAIKKP